VILFCKMHTCIIILYSIIPNKYTYAIYIRNKKHNIKRFNYRDKKQEIQNIYEIFVVQFSLSNYHFMLFDGMQFLYVRIR